MIESWDELAREMTTFHEEQIEANLEGFEMGEDPDPDTEHYIEVLDHETGCYVRFQIVNDSEVWITGTVPQDPERARSIADILHRCEGSSLFCGYHDPTWTLGWSHQFVDHNDRLKIMRPLAEVMRDGLGMRLQRLRIRLWSNDFGPGYDSHRLVSDRPSERGAPARCTTWADFVDRLDWTLHTSSPTPNCVCRLTTPGCSRCSHTRTATHSLSRRVCRKSSRRMRNSSKPGWSISGGVRATRAFGPGECRPLSTKPNRIFAGWPHA